ncbi:MAG: 16S rRNA (cytidine(1402)-2'-O)-methyltransferase [Acidobacteriota bacterium]
MNRGTLFIIATPIGNLEDISARALRILREADLIACEDTRHTSKLLTRYGIDTPRKSYHEYNEEKRTNELLLKLSEGMQIALVSDSGTPLVSDPGYEIVSACRREGVRIVAVPGPNAAISALVGSGLPTDSFLFAGFLPPRSAQRKRRLEELASIPATLIFYEAPHRILRSIADMTAVLGPRRAAVARELTKIHEEFIYGTLPELLDCLESKEKIQGEFAVVVDRGDPAAAPISYPASIKKHLQEELQKTGVSRNTALKSIAQQRGISRKQAYKMVLEEDN